MTTKTNLLPDEIYVTERNWFRQKTPAFAHKMTKYIRADLVIPPENARGDEALPRYWLIEQPDLDDDDDHKRIHTTDLDAYPGCKVLGEYVLKEQQKTAEPDAGALQRFKDYVHKRLDDAGIPTHPEGEHSKHGCRIGDRLDIALAHLTAISTQGIVGAVVTDEMVKAFAVGAEMGDGNFETDDPRLKQILDNSKTRIVTGLKAALTYKPSQDDKYLRCLIDVVQTDWGCGFPGTLEQDAYIEKAKEVFAGTLELKDNIHSTPSLSMGELEAFDLEMMLNRINGWGNQDIDGTYHEAIAVILKAARAHLESLRGK